MKGVTTDIKKWLDATALTHIAVAADVKFVKS